MAYAKYGEMWFNLGCNHQAQCWTENTRTGFRHLGIIWSNGEVINESKCVYYNRTWERFRYASLLSKLINGVQFKNSKGNVDKGIHTRIIKKINRMG